MADDDNPTAAAPAAKPTPQAAGAMLAQAREKAGLSIDYVALQLKLAPRQVRALESGDFAALPGRAFVRGFLRNYARLLDVDAQSVLGALPAGDDEPGLSHPHLANTHRVMGEIPAERARRRSFAGWAIVLALIAIIAIGVLYELLRPPWPKLRDPAEAPATSAPLAPAPQSAPGSPDGKSLPNPVAPEGSEAAPSSGAATDGAADANASAEAASQSNLLAQNVAMTSTSASAKATSAVAATGNAGAGNAPATKTSTLQIVFHGTSWLDVKDANGVSVLTMTGNDGATRTLDASPPLDLVIGNADHVDVIFRGEPVDLAAHSKQNVARLQLR